MQAVARRLLQGRCCCSRTYNAREQTRWWGTGSTTLPLLPQPMLG
jgi:hypothetical protein